jgi:outer membrane biosynthesis protein TonB
MEATLMKAFAAISTTALLLILGTAVPAFAQDEHHDQDAKPAQHEQQAKAPEHQEQAKPARQDAQAKPATQQAQAKPDRQQEQQTSSARQESRPQAAQQPQQERAKPARQEHQQQAKATQPATQSKQVRQQSSRNTAGRQHVQHTAADQQRQRSQPALRLSARSSSRIPDARFRSNFGRGHEFRIGSPRMVDGYSRFQYGGYWFGFVQPWPNNWYYTDDVYIDYIDGGYYLCNPSYPGDQIAVSVVL